MPYNQVLAILLILAAVGILIVALFSTTRILDELPTGPLRHQWRTLRVYTVFFLAGYLGYLSFVNAVMGITGILIALLFFLGACFVQMVCSLSLGTVRDIKRIATLETENITDPLMEIFNRRHLERRLEEECERAKRLGFPLSMIMLDLDHFKTINDTYGHPTGDLVLKEIGGILKKSVRRIDVPSRYGGEEAVVLLPHTGEGEAMLVSERIRRKIEAHPFPVDGADGHGGTLRCTVSIGVAVMTADCTNAGQLIQLADKALYQAKQAGRNRTEAFRCERIGESAGAGTRPE
ncbi:MAG: GGDEF domain-containing protein [Candidatus Deferrimicrobiaceae bacterium]